MAVPVLIFPGIFNSGPAHWQSRWQDHHPDWTRLEVPDWNRAERHDWVQALDRSIDRLGAETVIVAHSLACLAVAHWAAAKGRAIRGALLVAVPDPTSQAFPAEATGFAPLPMRALPFPSLIVASRNDPFAAVAHSRRCADAWGSRWVDAGAVGHLNEQSGLGEWVFGQRLLETWL